VSRFKIGGISHCNQAGKHTHDIVSYDITSQYPTAMRHMRVPIGRSSWVDAYDERRHGFYEITNLVWNPDVVKRFKIVCGRESNGEELSHVSPAERLTYARKVNNDASIKLEKGTRDWNNLGLTTLMDSYMIKYQMAQCGLVSFDVVMGLVSHMDIEASIFFGNYVDVLFAEKARQDELKDSKSAEYNVAYREVIKLFLNALTGKLVEDSSKYFNLTYTTEDTKETLGGVSCFKDRTGKKFNPWLVCGVIVYSYSKRLLHEYMRCMPNGTDDIINVETDSMYFDKKHQAAFIANVNKIKSDYPIRIGKGVNAPLGCVKQEYDVSGDSYFLGKKFYGLGKTIQENGQHQVSYHKDGTIEVVTVDGPYEVLKAMKIKGIPMKTKNAHGIRPLHASARSEPASRAPRTLMETMFS
jgi:hypothetical protein